MSTSSLELLGAPFLSLWYSLEHPHSVNPAFQKLGQQWVWRAQLLTSWSQALSVNSLEIPWDSVRVFNPTQHLTDGREGITNKIGQVILCTLHHTQMLCNNIGNTAIPDVTKLLTTPKTLWALFQFIVMTNCFHSTLARENFLVHSYYLWHMVWKARLISPKLRQCLLDSNSACH